MNDESRSCPACEDCLSEGYDTPREFAVGIYTIRKLFKFEAAHRLVSSYSRPCQRIHGHSYKLELFLRSQELNKDGMVVDFGRVRDAFKACLEQFDHKLVLSEKDAFNDKLAKFASGDPESFGCIFVPFNPTAENMAKFFYEMMEAMFYQDEELRSIEIAAVRIHETDTGWAEYSR